jgi:hypothetical protein
MTRKAKINLKKKLSKFFKKKAVIEDEPIIFKPISLEEKEPAAEENFGSQCECGRLADPGSHQCWGCSHRT